MPQKIGIGYQSFSTIRESKFFYVDKTSFIREWWESGIELTLITRPRRFGKTLAMSMLECFFSRRYKGREDLFKGLTIWRYKKFRALQGTFPVINLSFASVNATTFSSASNILCGILKGVFSFFRYLKESPLLNENDKEIFDSYSLEVSIDRAIDALWWLSNLLFLVEKKPVIILLDEYDAPLQEAWLNGYWKEMSSFMRAFFVRTFKDNSFLGRGVLIGVSQLSKESIFSDLNNLSSFSVLTKGMYETAFGFTKEEVSAALEKYGISKPKGVKKMYEGFVFGSQKEMYSPWSILPYLSRGGELQTWWVKSSSNGLVEELIKEGSLDVQKDFTLLLQGGFINKKLNEHIVFSQLQKNSTAIWSLLVGTGYLTASSSEDQKDYILTITNGEVYEMFEQLVLDCFWNDDARTERNEFTKAMLIGDINGMNQFMKSVAESTFSVFDSGTSPSEKQAERFYHGFVLGLIVQLKDRYCVWSNRESGRGRYDVVLEPKAKNKDDAFILEFKVMTPENEKSLIQSVENALTQIDSKEYDRNLLDKGIPSERIHKYGFAFCGKELLIDDKSERGRKAYREQQKDLSFFREELA